MDVPIARPDIRPEDADYVLEVLQSGWLVQGPKVAAFEAAWSEFTDSAHSVAVTSCTSGLLLSLTALGFGHGDEAIVPAFTWTATANVVEQLGGRVVFCDVDPNTFNLNIDQVSQLIGRTYIPNRQVGTFARFQRTYLVVDSECTRRIQRHAPDALQRS